MNLLDFLFPKRCVGCQKIGVYFCSDCIRDIQQGELVCPFCERPSIGGLTHPICQRKYGLSGLWSLGIYKGPLKKAIQKLKYKWVRELVLVLANIVIEYWASYQPLILDQIKKSRGKDWRVVAVPLHLTRERWRGFNQSELMAKLLAEKMGLKYQALIKRVKKTKPQVGLSSRERRQNIKGAFALTVPYNLSAVNLILVDDVWTTGSTLKECTLVLKRAGAASVWALTLAR